MSTMRADGTDLDPSPMIELGLGPSGRRFVSEQLSRHHRRTTWAARSLMRTVAGDFALNGLFGTYPLHLLGTELWRELLVRSSVDLTAPLRLLDVGGGSGDVTAGLAPLVASVTATEVNRPMVRRMRRAGIDAHLCDITSDVPPGGPFDLVTVLNVLDRCAHPVTLLSRAVRVLRPGGVLIVAMPLPYQPCWYSGPRLRAPREELSIDATSFVAGCASLARHVGECGIDVVLRARAPYLSGGDPIRPLYELDDAIVVGRRRRDVEPA